jgi:hypothetical protein
VHCYPRHQQIPHIRAPIQQICEALLEHGKLKPYEVQHALEALEVFWIGIVNRTRKLEDYKAYFKEL